MEWRCTWCGKPHAEDDPPCDNCGHSRFERMVVPVFETDGPEQLEWVCTECGRSHPRNSPPCSRCGNTTLEVRELEYGDIDDVGRPSYLDLASPRYMVLATVVVVLAIVVALGAVGIVDLPGAGPPAVSDVPGHADEAGNLSLESVEREFAAGLDDRRREAGYGSLRTDEALSGVAEFLNQRYVKAAYGDGERPDVNAAFDGFDATCPVQPAISLYSSTNPGYGNVTVSDFDSETELAAALVEVFDRGEGSMGPDHTLTGADVHVAPDGSIYVTRIAC